MSRLVTFGNIHYFEHFRNNPAKVNIDILTAGCRSMIKWRANEEAPFWRYWCNNSSGMTIYHNDKEYPLLPNQAYIVPPGTKVKTSTTSTVSEHFFIHFVLENSSVIAKQGIYKSTAHLMNRALTEKLKIDENISITDSYSTIFQITSIISEGLSAIPDELWGGLSNDSALSNVLHFMNVNYDKKINNEILAKIACLAKNSFVRKFTQKMGVSPNKHLEQIRLAKAKIALLYSRKPIDVIAEESGFNDRYYFTTRFKKNFDITPAKYVSAYANSFR